MDDDNAHFGLPVTRSVDGTTYGFHLRAGPCLTSDRVASRHCVAVLSMTIHGPPVRVSVRGTFISTAVRCVRAPRRPTDVGGSVSHTVVSGERHVR